MAENNQFLHEVAITAIIVKDGKFLITRRSLKKKRFPGMWTVPGGRLEAKDYLALPKDSEHYWYNVLEGTLKREVMEEVGLKIDNVEYVTSLATVHADGAPSIVISCVADWVGGEVKLQVEESDEHAWVTLEESKSYKMLDGIYEEFIQVENMRKKGKRTLWEKAQKA